MWIMHLFTVFFLPHFLLSCFEDILVLFYLTVFFVNNFCCCCAFIKALAVCVGFRTVSVCVNDRDNMLYRVINDASSKPRRIQIISQFSPLFIDQSQIAPQLDIHYS